MFCWLAIEVILVCPGHCLTSDLEATAIALDGRTTASLPVTWAHREPFSQMNISPHNLLINYFITESCLAFDVHPLVCLATLQNIFRTTKLIIITSLRENVPLTQT